MPADLPDTPQSPTVGRLATGRVTSPAARTPVWILNHYAVGPGMVGGTRHYALARQLVSLGYDVTIFAADWNHLEKRRTTVGSRRNFTTEHVDGVRFVWLRTTPYWKNDWRRVLNILSYGACALWHGLKTPTRIGLKRPAVIVGSSVHLLAVCVGRLLAWRHRTGFVMEVRDLWPQTAIDVGALSANGIPARVLRMVERYLYRHSDRIITLLPFASEYICPLGVPQERVVWISNGVDLSMYPPVEPKVDETGTFDIYFAGNHGHMDGLDVILETAALLQRAGVGRIRFVLVGNGTEKQNLVERSHQLGLTNVEFKDAVPRGQVLEILRNADACIIINHDLSLYRFGISSNKLFDYLAVGRPVILVGDVRGNIVEASGCGVTVKTCDPEQVAQACRQLLAMPPEARHQMGLCGREYVERQYDYRVLGSVLAACVNAVSRTETG